MKIPVPREFSMAECIHFLKRSPKELLHKIEDAVIYKLLKIENETILVKITSTDQHLDVLFPIAEPTDEAKHLVRQYIIEWFDLERDLKPFYELASADPFLSELVKKHFGYRIVGQPDLYESLIWAVLGQQINLQFAYSLKQQFVREYGKKLVLEGNEYFLFPEPATVAQLSVDELLKIQFSRQKARYAIGISEAFVEGTIAKSKLEGLSLMEAKEKLMKIKGIGNWTANYALMKTFRYADAFPLEDAGLSNALKKFLNLNRKPTLDEIREEFVKYKGWEAYATLYLWRSL